MYDVAVVGAGLIGAAAAKHLAKKGLKVALIGPTESQGALGACYDEGRIYRIADPDKVWADLADLSIKEYQTIEREAGESFHHETGFLAVGDPSMDYIHQVEQTMASFGTEGQDFFIYTKKEEFEQHFRFLRLSFDEHSWRGLWQPRKAGHLSPRSLARIQAALARRNGADVIETQLDGVHPEVELQRIVQKEQKRRGVLVRKAWYGNLQLRPELLHEVLQGERPIQPEELQGPWIDVASAVQCLVEQSAIRVHGSATYSKADLPGFYNPTPLNSQVELSLYVLYDFRETLHEVIVDDRESLTIPLRKHLVSGDHPRGPFASSNVELLLRRRQLEAEVASPCSSPRLDTRRVTRRRRIRTSEEELQGAVKRHTVLRVQGPGFRSLKREFNLLLLCSTALVILLAVQKSF